MVGAPGFEPGTSRTPSVRATRLRYAPTDLILTLSPLFQKRQERPQRIAQIQKHFAIQQRRHTFRVTAVVRSASAAPAGGAFPVRATWVSQVPARSGNRESLVVKQPLYF